MVRRISADGDLATIHGQVVSRLDKSVPFLELQLGGEYGYTDNGTQMILLMGPTL
jgi:hypothetical protein